jgi:hypothetical protein
MVAAMSLRGLQDREPQHYITVSLPHSACMHRLRASTGFAALTSLDGPVRAARDAGARIAKAEIHGGINSWGPWRCLSSQGYPSRWPHAWWMGWWWWAVTSGVRPSSYCCCCYCYPSREPQHTDASTDCRWSCMCSQFLSRRYLPFLFGMAIRFRTSFFHNSHTGKVSVHC